MALKRWFLDRLSAWRLQAPCRARDQFVRRRFSAVTAMPVSKSISVSACHGDSAGVGTALAGDGGEVCPAGGPTGNVTLALPTVLFDPGGVAVAVLMMLPDAVLSTVAVVV
jgi:hypothetical protein